MVWSQVYSEHPSHCILPNGHQCRSRAVSNAHMQCQEPETSEGNWLGSATRDGHMWSPKGYACSDYANTTSPFKSSWIQRLIPSQSTRAEEPQHNRENQGFDGVQSSSKQNTDYLTVVGNQSDCPVYENSRRSKHRFLRSNQPCQLCTVTPGCVGNSVNIAAISTPYKVPSFRLPEIQVSPKPLPVVESLLPGCSKKVLQDQASSDTKMPHIFSRCSGLVNPVQQTVHYSADEKSRVSCSSIGGLNSHSVVRAAGDFLSRKSLQAVKRSIDSLQPFSEFPFNSHDAMGQLNIDPAFDGKDGPVGTNLRTQTMSPQTEDQSVPFCRENTYPNFLGRWAPSVARVQAIENSLLDRYSLPFKAECIDPLQESFPQANLLASKTGERSVLGFNVENLTDPKTISNGNCENPKECCSYAGDGSEALFGRTGSCVGGWGSMEKDRPHQTFNLVSAHCGTSLVQENPCSSSSHYLIEQELHSSHGAYEECDGTSRSFSFNLENPSSDRSSLFTRKVQWPFGASQPSSENLVQQTRWSEDNKTRNLVELTRLGPPRHNHSIFEGTGLDEAGTLPIDRSQCSPFFVSGNLKESDSSRISDIHEDLLYKAACNEIKEVSVNEVNEDSVLVERSLLGGHKISRLESSLMEGIEGIELMYCLPSGTIDVNKWKLFGTSIKSSTNSCLPEGTRLNHTGGNCVSATSIKSSTNTCLPEGTRLNHTGGNCVSASHWQGFKPSIRSGIRTCPPEGINLYTVDGNPSTGIVRSCLKMPANLCSEHPSTIAGGGRPRTQVKPVALLSVALPDQLRNSWKESGVSSGNAATDDGEYEGKEALRWEGPGSAVKKNIWLQRWSRKLQPVSRLKRQGRVLAGSGHTRNYLEDNGTSQGKREYSHYFDLRSAKRMCCENRSGLQPSSGNSNSQLRSVFVEGVNTEKGLTSHFMKRFFSPSVAALAIMGMTARKMRAQQPEKTGLFGVWASKASERKPSAVHAEVCK